MLHGKACEQNRQRNGFRDAGQPRLAVEPRQQTPGGGERDRQHDAHADVDPEEVARETMVDVVPLKKRLREAIQPEVHQEQTDCGDHSQEPEVGRGQQPSQDDRGQQLNGEADRLGKHGDARAAQHCLA